MDAVHNQHPGYQCPLPLLGTDCFTLVVYLIHPSLDTKFWSFMSWTC